MSPEMFFSRKTGQSHRYVKIIDVFELDMMSSLDCLFFLRLEQKNSSRNYCHFHAWVTCPSLGIDNNTVIDKLVTLWESWNHWIAVASGHLITRISTLKELAHFLLIFFFIFIERQWTLDFPRLLFSYLDLQFTCTQMALKGYSQTIFPETHKPTIVLRHLQSLINHRNERSVSTVSLEFPSARVPDFHCLDTRIVV